MKTPKVIIDESHPCFKEVVDMMSDLIACNKNESTKRFTFLIFCLEEIRLVFGVKVDHKGTMEYLVESGIFSDQQFVSYYTKHKDLY